MENQAKPSIGKSILFAVMCFIGFYICYLLIAFLLSLLTAFLIYVPVLNLLVRLFYSVRGDSPTFLVPALSAALGYEFASWLIGRVTDDRPTEKLTFKILGIAVVVFNIGALILNIINKSDGPTFLSNIILLVTGVVFTIKGFKE